MKNTVDLKIEGKAYTLSFDIKALAELERGTGKSLVFLFGTLQSNPAATLNMLNIDFVAKAIEASLKDKPENFDVYDFIDAYCEQNDANYDELVKRILKGVLNAGLFMKGDRAKNEEILNLMLGQA